MRKEFAASYHILSIDGGGPNVLMSLLLLRRIEQAHPGFLATVDLFAGTSAGGISAMLLAAEADPRKGLDTAITFWENSGTFLRQTGHALAGVIGATSFFSNAPLRRELQRCLGNATLQALPHQVLVATVQLDNGRPNPDLRSWRPLALSNLPAAGHTVLQATAVDTALRSAAAPVIWPIHQGYVDGGLFANDPSMLALSCVLEARRNRSVAGGHARDTLNEIRLFSVGEGQVPHYLQAGNESWGYRQWLFHARQPHALLELALNSTAEAIAEQCRLLLGDHQYYRLNPDTKPPLGRALHVSRPVSYLRSLLRRVTAPVDELADPLETLLQHARAIGSSYDLRPTDSWLKSTGWPGGGMAPPSPVP